MKLEIGQLKKKLSQQLPGIVSQLKMAPKHRTVELEAMQDKLYLAKQSAVLILLFPEDDTLKIVFIKRAEYDGVHSGQIAFPGGKKEETDADFEATALRETYEEIGVKQTDIKVLGQLTDLFIPPSNFLVKVFVGYCAQKPDFEVNTIEVQTVIEINLIDFLGENVIIEKEFQAKALKTQLIAPCYSVNNIEIWGATAMIMSELLDVLKL